MTSEELAEEVAYLVKESSGRVVGTGHEQYWDGEYQNFEKMQIEEVFKYTYEEIEDLVAYATMIHIRLRRLEDAILNRIKHLRGLDCL